MPKIKHFEKIGLSPFLKEINSSFLPKSIHEEKNIILLSVSAGIILIITCIVFLSFWCSIRSANNKFLEELESEETSLINDCYFTYNSVPIRVMMLSRTKINDQEALALSFVYLKSIEDSIESILEEDKEKIKLFGFDKMFFNIFFETLMHIKVYIPMKAENPILKNSFLARCGAFFFRNYEILKFDKLIKFLKTITGKNTIFRFNNKKLKVYDCEFSGVELTKQKIAEFEMGDNMMQKMAYLLSTNKKDMSDAEANAVERLNLEGHLSWNTIKTTTKK